ncbi:EamA family transporter [Corynebacterium renale]|uniref:EamA family transporter n=1 Tax=Corynebacterium renale TaxID=1724 RepID=UPI000DFBB51E|nr:EamA family transporter [Corynebacterium renale]STD00025.1 phosphonate utilization associated putative membrane protein [Corynebacterium renale]
MSWVLAAVAAAFFAGVTSILAKVGVRTTDSDVATAIRTAVVLVFAWAMVGVVGSAGQIADISAFSLTFLVLSGLATGISWIFFFKALATGPVNAVVPIDKSSAALATLAAIPLFGETSHLGVKLVATAVILAGTMLMIDRKEDSAAPHSRAWLLYAVIAAVAAAATSLLAKVGIQDIESNLATAIRTTVVLLFAWAIVFARGKAPEVARVSAREGLFLVLSGLATGASWLFFYYAIQQGQVAVVVQIDKLSILVTVAFAAAVFGEKLSRRAGLSLAMLTAGTIAMTVWR